MEPLLKVFTITITLTDEFSNSFAAAFRNKLPSKTGSQSHLSLLPNHLPSFFLALSV